jgi:hypothetical protein
MGGLGNQMFQYAFARSLSLNLKTELKLDDTLLLDRRAENIIIRDFSLSVFNIEENFASEKEIIYYNGYNTDKLHHKILNKLSQGRRRKNLVVQQYFHFNPESLNIGDNICLVGSWQSFKYFEANQNVIHRDFSFKKQLFGKTKILADKISAENSVCINVRRGDYVTHPVYSKTLGFVGLDYYVRSVDLIKKKLQEPIFYIFSDDLVWCKQNLSFEKDIVFVEHDMAGEKFSEYLHLMTLCKHSIIPNSTFGWWGAWLNKNPEKIVIAPKIWYRDKSFNTKDLLPNNWIKL